MLPWIKDDHGLDIGNASKILLSRVRGRQLVRLERSMRVIEDFSGSDPANIGDFPKILLGRLFGCHKRRIEGVADCLGSDALDIGNIPEVLRG